MISSKKEIENILKQERNKLLNILDAIQDGIYICSKDFKIEYVNPVIKKRLGNPGKKKCYDYLFARKDRCPWCKGDEVFKGKTIRWEWYDSQSGKTYDLIDTPLKNPDGTISKLKIFHDISERIKKEKELQDSHKKLEKKVEKTMEELIVSQKKLSDSKRLSDIGTLAATVAHELRNPLGVIGTAIYNIKRKSKDDKLGKHIENIEKKITESEQIINNLLNYSRIKSPRLKKVDISALFDECLETIKDRYSDYNVDLKSDYFSLKNIKIKIDPLQIREVLLNILNNAYQALPDKYGNVKLSASIKDKLLLITIKDNGQGIADKDSDKIFNPFFTRKSKGTGLGLAICKELVNLHNGTIKIRSTKGKGTTVQVILALRLAK